MALSSEDLAASLSLGEGGCGVAGQENKTICSNPVQCSYLENSMDIGAWQATVHGITTSWTQLGDYYSLT